MKCEEIYCREEDEGMESCEWWEDPEEVAMVKADERRDLEHDSPDFGGFLP